MKLNLFVHFLEETLSLSLAFCEFLLAMLSSLCKILAPLFYMLLCSTLGIFLLHGDAIQPRADFHPDHLH